MSTLLEHVAVGATPPALDSRRVDHTQRAPLALGYIKRVVEPPVLGDACTVASGQSLNERALSGAGSAEDDDIDPIQLRRAAFEMVDQNVMRSDDVVAYR